jgi:hypothetical protein
MLQDAAIGAAWRKMVTTYARWPANESSAAPTLINGFECEALSHPSVLL